MSIDATDRAIIEALQGGLPLVPAPYAEVAETLELSERELTSRLAEMKASGVIRRIAAAPNHYKLGMTSNGMTVMSDSSVARKAVTAIRFQLISKCSK